MTVLLVCLMLGVPVDNLPDFTFDNRGDDNGGGGRLEFSTSKCESIRRSYRHSTVCSNTDGFDIDPNREPAPCLLTGVGRAGTKYVAHLLNELGWSINHDDLVSFCPCPGMDGSVAHPYAFKATRMCRNAEWAPRLRHMFSRLGHVIRNPLGYINSRAHNHPKGVPDYFPCNMMPPPPIPGLGQDIRNARQAMYKWTLQNTFVHHTADFQLRIEDVNGHPEAIEPLCHACGLADRVRVRRNGRQSPVPRDQRRGGWCPSVGEISEVQASLLANENSHWTVKANYSWAELFAIDPDMTTATIITGRAFGYKLAALEPTVGLVVRCGFGRLHSRVLRMLRRNVSQRQWECRLVRPEAG